MEVKNKIGFLNSGIGQKVTMALTGLFLCIFLIVHLTGNFQLFHHDSGLAFNEYAVFMTTFPPIKFVSYGLYAMILYHAFKGLHLAYKNTKARPVKYQVEKASANSPWTSRYMGVLGTIILVFICTHMSNFWWEYHNGPIPLTKYETSLVNGTMTASTYVGEIAGKKLEYNNADNTLHTVIIKDLYVVVAEAFHNIGLVILYVLAMAALGFHLVHGFQSSFQTVGFNHVRYTKVIQAIGIYVFGIAIPIAFAAMPIYFYLLSIHLI
ncbi:MAG: succinate dehydrogenase cytochrome b subunit [Bacteroidia bacterium]|nr:succinate dehydrogenase cytochrome b subunit [Bacteroidia bacterium]